MQKQTNKIRSRRPYAYVISVHERGVITIHQTVINGVGKTAYPKVGVGRWERRGPYSVPFD